MKKIILFVLILAVLASTAMACSGTSSGTQTVTVTSTATSVAQSTAATLQPTKLSCMIIQSNLSAFPDIVRQAAFDRIKTRTNGLLDIQTVFQGSLPIQAEEWYRAVSKGDLDMALLTGDYHAADFPLFGLLQTPYLYNNEQEKNQVLINTWAIVQREMEKDGIHIISPEGNSEVGFWSTEPIANLLDVGGTKLRAQAQVYTDITKAINGVPVPVQWAEAYTSLQRGLVKGIFTGYDSVSSAKLEEVAPYATRIYLGSSVTYLAMNKKKWDSLPASVQLIVQEEIGNAYITVESYLPNAITREIAAQKLDGLKSYTPDPPAGWFQLMADKVTKVELPAQLAASGAVGQEIVPIIEKTLGRKIQ